MYFCRPVSLHRLAGRKTFLSDSDIVLIRLKCPRLRVTVHTFQDFPVNAVAASEESDDDITILDDVNRSPPDADDGAEEN